MDPITATFQSDSDSSIAHLREELKSIRTGKAHPSLLENLQVLTYGGQTKLRLLELATIQIEGPLSLAISPFDPSTTQDIEKAILSSPLGLSPSVQTGKIVIKIPSLSEEQRQKMIKLVNSTIESHRETIRNARDNARKTIRQQLEKKEVTEDDKYRLEKEIDEMSQKLMEQVEEIREKKKAEIMEV